MGIRSQGRCCGRNIVFDVVTGGGGEPPCLNPICAVNEFPDPTECQLISFQTIDSTSFSFDIQVWNEDFAQWDVVASVNGVISEGQATSYGDVVTTTGWTIFGNGVEVVAFDPTPSGVVVITFVSGDCTYTMPTAGTDCGELCTVESVDDLPNPNTCFVAKVAEIGGDPKDVSIYKYISGSWVQLYDITDIIQTGETITSITFTVESGYEISLDPDGLVWFSTSGTEVVSYPWGVSPKVRDIATGCVYTADPIFYVTTTFITDEDLADFAGWTYIDGSFTANTALNTYIESIFPGFTFRGSVQNLTGSNAPSYRSIFYAGNTTPPDLQIEDDLGNPITLTWSVVWAVCVQAQFTVSDPSLAVPLSQVQNSKAGWGNFTPPTNFASGTIGSYLSAGRLSQIQPGGTVDVNVVGNDITVLARQYLIAPVMGLEIDDNGSTITPSFTIVQCP